MNRISEQVSHDLANLIINQPKAYKTCLNIGRTEIVLFKSARKETGVPLKRKLDEKRLCTINSVKYFDVKIDKNLNWEQQINRKTPKAINKTIFEPHSHSSFSGLVIRFRFC